LFETALGGIATEVEKHDLQRDSMVEKLRSIIADVSDENSDQVFLLLLLLLLLLLRGWRCWC
jgi:hypothetical protein